MLNQASSRKHQSDTLTAGVTKRQKTLYKTPVKLSGEGKVILACYKCNILLILPCHFSACWLPGSHGKPQPSQEVSEHLGPGLILLHEARGEEGLCKVCTLWAPSCWGQGKLRPWQEGWILVCFRGGILYNYSLMETHLIHCSAVCAN